MDWWNDLTDWISSDDGWRVISGAIIPFVAIVVAGVVAALIGRGATKRVVAMQEREARNAAVSGVVSAARKAATWGSLGHDERAYADHLAEDSDIRLRLLPVTGAPLAANWTQHEIADIKKNSSTFSFQAEQSLAEFRDRLLEWQARPSRARKLFKSDLERWKFDSPDPDAELIKRQQDWNADQNGSSRASEPTTTEAAPTTDRPTPTTTSLRPAPQRPTSAPAATSTTGSAPGSAPATATATVPGGSTAGFSVSRSGSATTDPNATTPISDEHGDENATTPISDGNATRAYGDGATRAYGDDTTRTAAAPIRPPLGSPVSPTRAADSSTRDHADSGADGAANGAADSDGGARTDGAANDGARSSAPVRSASASASAPASAVSSPTSADAHVNRASASGRTADAPGTTNTRSVPTRIANDPAEPTDANETSEAPYTQPISASELRRRAADDDE